jgi:Abortive infection alpha
VATAFAKELADKFPVEEALTPAATQTGLILSDFVKTLHLALVPFQLLGAYQDRLRNFIDNSVRRVPEEKRFRPAPQILGPAIEGIRYEPEGTPIEVMFSELLSRSIDKDRVEEAHPAYPLIIRQLSADEAKILGRLKEHGFDYVYTKALNDLTKLFSGESTIEVDAFPRDGLSFPNNISFYFDHLNQLGLSGISNR